MLINWMERFPLAGVDSIKRMGGEEYQEQGDKKRKRVPETRSNIEVSNLVTHTNFPLDGSTLEPAAALSSLAHHIEKREQKLRLPSSSELLPSISSLYNEAGKRPPLTETLPSFTTLFGPRWASSPRQRGDDVGQPQHHSFGSLSNSEPYWRNSRPSWLPNGPATPSLKDESESSSPHMVSHQITSSETAPNVKLAPFSSSSCGRFVLLEQPNEIQRKSYKNESRYTFPLLNLTSRYLLPNPLVICQKTPLPADKPLVYEGTVSVKIGKESLLIC